MKKIIKIGVVGAGQMGRGIAQVGATSGLEVILYDSQKEALTYGNTFIKGQLEKGVVKNKWDEKFASEALQRVTVTSDLKDLANCDGIIEAIVEDISAKKSLFVQLDEVVKSSSIFLSNTSSISITEMASWTKRPQQFMGMHFMNPVPVMKLVEGIRGLATTDETLQQVKSLSEIMGKTFIEVRDMPGFAVNRILMPMINEAMFALYEGIASKEDLDLSMKLGTNMPMGPLQLADFIGLDTCLSILEVLHEGHGDPKFRPCPLLKQYVSAGWLGKKKGRGIYEY